MSVKPVITNKHKFFYDDKIKRLFEKFEIAIEQSEPFQVALILHSLKRDYNLSLVKAEIKDIDNYMRNKGTISTNIEQ